MMDFLDPKKTRAHTVRLQVGYVLLAIAVGLAVSVLLYQARGFGVSQGKVIQNGVVFLSSNPSGASIYLNNQKQSDATNARLIMASGPYTVRLERDGYRSWQRAVTVEGGSVGRFDYPWLIPNQLTPTVSGEYASLPPLVTQSPDRRWMLVQLPDQANSFDMYDIRDPQNVADRKTSFSLPADIVSLPQTGAQTFVLAEWSRDNSHLLVQHIVGDQSEYIMINRDNPEQSFNLTKRLELTPSATVTLLDKKYDRYFIHDKSALTLTTANLDNPRPVSFLAGVIDYKTYGTNVVLYATASGALDGKVSIKLYQDDKSYPIRQVAKYDDYMLDVSTYDSQLYVVVGVPGDDHIMIYRNPVQALKRDSTLPLVPVDILKLAGANYLEFSANSQFLMAQSGQDIAVFDAENERSYNYKLDRPIDAPQAHITWMDGYHLSFVSGGKATVLDYDGSNVQTLLPSLPEFQPFFDTSYRTLYTVSAGDAGADSARKVLSATPLRTVRDR